MNKTSTFYITIGLLIGVLITYPIVAAMNAHPTKQDNVHMGSSMDDMLKFLEGKTENEFDKSFLEAFIVHHEGAINMAKLAEEATTNKEIQDLAHDIIDSQTKEMEKMKTWLEAKENLEVENTAN